MAISPASYGIATSGSALLAMTDMLTFFFLLATLLTACNARHTDEPLPFPTQLPEPTYSPLEPITGKPVCDGWVDYQLGKRIFLTDLATGIVQQLTVESSGSPKWSPDGKQIAFVAYIDGNPDIYVMNASGSSQRRLTNDPGYDSQVNWSPDGKQIVFVSDRASEDTEIFTLTFSTGEIKHLTFNDCGEGVPAWSANGEESPFSQEMPLSAMSFISWILMGEISSKSPLPFMDIMQDLPGALMTSV